MGDGIGVLVTVSVALGGTVRVGEAVRVGVPGVPAVTVAGSGDV